jgi:hypothetical protein
MPHLVSRLRVVFCLTVCAALIGCATAKPQAGIGAVVSGGALDYYPLLPGWGWAYDVEREGGNVLAVYSVIERRSDVAVVKNGDDRIEYAVLADGIARRDGNLPGDYLLKTPVRSGASWPVASGTATVVEMGKDVSLPSGTFRNCAVVEEVRREPDRVTRTTYCKLKGPVEIEMRVWNPLTRVFEIHVRARIMNVSYPEDAVP